VNWTRWHTAYADPSEEGASELKERQNLTGEYLSLHKYLANRYADTVVLRFLEIEDLMGALLPTAARLRQDWWIDGEPDLPPQGHADAWRLAHRKATVNLSAETVTFERIASK